ncbi:MAG: magnesium/cobalt transporter CorA [Bacteroidetes bacterium]|jgi:magnesium transporter|nr:magnesium/cobalt transporter CorA [Bacteroidota bacterium]
MKPRHLKKLTKKTGMPPGAVCYIGEQRDFIPNLNLIEYSPDFFEQKTIKRISEVDVAGRNHVHWLNVEGIHDTQLIEQIGEHFQLHPLILEDIVNTSQRPKLEEYDNCVFITLKSLVFNEKEKRVTPEQISIVLFKNLVITFQEQIGDTLSEVLERIKLSKFKIRGKGTDYLVYALIDLIVDKYYFSIEALGSQLELLEDEVFNNPSPASLQKIQSIKHELLEVRRSVYPLREVINRFQKDDLDFINENNLKYFNDVYDHTIKIIDTIETYRELNTGLKDIYLSSISLKMNQIMQVLTIVGAIFIPITFLAGVYGMNFDYMPELHWKYSYPVFWLIILLIIGALITFFRRKKWL